MRTWDEIQEDISRVGKALAMTDHGTPEFEQAKADFFRLNFEAQEFIRAENPDHTASVDTLMDSITEILKNEESLPVFGMMGHLIRAAAAVMAFYSGPQDQRPLPSEVMESLTGSMQMKELSVLLGGVLGDGGMDASDAMETSILRAAIRGL